MPRIHYTPGDWLAVVHGPDAVMLPESTDDATVSQVAAALRNSSGLVEVIDVVAGAFGASLSLLPPFAVVLVRESEVQIAVRGEVELRLVPLDGAAEAGEATVLTGARTRTWHEQAVDLSSVGGVRIDAGPPAVTPARRFPILSGVVPAGRLEIADLAAPTSGLPDADGAEPAVTPPAVSMARPTDTVQAADDERPVDDEPPAPPEPQSPVDPAEGQVVSEGTLAELTVQGPDGDDQEHDAPSAPEPGDEAAPANQTESTAGDPPEPTGPPNVEDSVIDYGHLWESTVAQGVENAAVRPDPDSEEDEVMISGVPSFGGAGTVAAAEGAQPPVGSTESLGDHDGHTVASGPLLDQLRSRGETHAPQVLARRCGAGHDNPPHAVYCGVCGTKLDASAEQVARPTLGRVRLANGELIELDRGVILGRRPQANRVGPGAVPRLVPIDAQEVSRNHIEIRLEEWNVLGVDLGSRNGTLLRRDGQDPVRLTAHEPIPLRTGDLLDLGEGHTLTFEDIP